MKKNHIERWTVGLAGVFVYMLAFAVAASSMEEPQSVDGLHFQTVTTNVCLIWPSHPHESFAILWRPNNDVQVPWVVLTNPLPALTKANETTFLDTGAFGRSSKMAASTNFVYFYRVFVVPDFWFDMNGIELVGGPDCGEDFLPFYSGSKEADDLFTPQITLLVDGEQSGFLESEKPFYTEEATERINFGTRKQPRWAHARGLWFTHDTLPNGEHTYQLAALLTLNLFVGEQSQYLKFTNRPVRVRINNELSYPNWHPLILGNSYTFTAHSATQRVNWRIDVYDSRGQFLMSKSGRTTDGEIRWNWDLRDKQGLSHDNFDTDFSFKSHLTTWPLDEQMKGAQALQARQDKPISREWWTDRLGRDFVRKQPSQAERDSRTVNTNKLPSEDQLLSRPLELPKSVSP